MFGSINIVIGISGIMTGCPGIVLKVIKEIAMMANIQ
jgi:hypothetical protein